MHGNYDPFIALAVQGFTEAGCDELILLPCSRDPDQVDLLADAFG